VEHGGTGPFRASPTSSVMHRSISFIEQNDLDNI
jgi:hypothetical protein